MSTILFELGTEELPPKNLKTLRDALNDHVTQSLKDANIRFDTIKSFAAPRRLALQIQGISEKDDNKVMGYTDTMKLVNVMAPKNTIGTIINVKITEAKSFSLDGEIVE